MKHIALILLASFAINSLALTLNCKVEGNTDLQTPNSVNSAVAFVQVDLQNGKATFVVKDGGTTVITRNEQVTGAKPNNPGQVRLSFSDVDHRGDSFAIYLPEELPEQIAGYITRIGGVYSGAPSESNYDKIACSVIK